MSNSCYPMDSSLPGSSVHGILQARILEWVAISFSRRSSQPRNRMGVSCIAGRSLPVKLQGKPSLVWINENSKEIQPVYPKGDQSWVFFGGTDVEDETLILWLPDAKSWFIGKDPDAGKDWGQEKKMTTGWDGWMASPTQWTWVWVDTGSWDGQGGMACCGSWGHRESDITEQLNWTKWKQLKNTGNVKCLLDIPNEQNE